MDDAFEAFATKMQAAAAIESKAGPPPTSSASGVMSVDEIAAAIERAEALKEATKITLSALYDLVDRMTAGSTEGRLDGVGKAIIVTRKPRKGWDQEKLEALAGSSPDPYIKTTYSADERVVAKLPEAERNAIMAARIHNGETVKVEIEDLL